MMVGSTSRIRCISSHYKPQTDLENIQAMTTWFTWHNHGCLGPVFLRAKRGASCRGSKQRGLCFLKAGIMVHVLEDLPEPRVVVGLDFGTTFSGFAYAHKSDPEKVYLFYEWPHQASGGGRPYCKTQTSLFYDAHLKYQIWGWPAQVFFSQALQASRLKRNKCLPGVEDVHVTKPHADVGHFITKFKLHLAGDEHGPLSAEKLPTGLTVGKVIPDYLRYMSKFIMDHLKTRFGSHLTMNEVQWCLTVPTIWDDCAKQKMREYVQDAGMLLQRNSAGSSDSGSPHPLSIILEPEAAAVYCHHKLKNLCLHKGDKFLTADIGGGTVDIVVHSKINEGSRPQLKEVTRSTGGLCGGTYVDRSFLFHLSERIRCFNSFLEDNPTTTHSLLRWCEGVKSTFDGTSSVTLEVPAKLVRAWEADDLSNAITTSSGYDELDLSVEDLQRIFDTVIQKIIKLIEDQLLQSHCEDVKAIMVVGGFAASPYLMRRLRDKFSGVVREVVSPPEPGSAVAQGAVMLGISHNDLITSRISRKTYGVELIQVFRGGVDPVSKQIYDDDGVLRCTNVFFVFVRKGSEVPVNKSVAHVIEPVYHGMHSLEVSLYQSSEANPGYTTDESVAKVGNFVVDISEGLALDKDRKVTLTMYFGRSSIQVFAEPVNFGSRVKTRMLELVFDQGTTESPV